MLKCNSAVPKLTKWPAPRSVLPLSCSFRSASTTAPPITVDHLNDELWQTARPYTSIPGPTKWDLMKLLRPGGSFSKKPFCEIQREFKNRYGNLVRLQGMLGKADTVFVYEPEDMAKIYRTEGQYPIRRGLDSITYYRRDLRSDLFNKTGGLGIDQGKDWWSFRQKVNGLMMSPKATKPYVPQIDEIAQDFVQKLHYLRSADNKVPPNFLNLMNMWALESACYISMDTRIGLFEDKEDPVAMEFMGKLKLFFDYIYQFDILPSIWKVYQTPTFKAHMKNMDDMTNCALYFLEKGKAQLQERQRTNAISENEPGVLEKLLKIDEDIALVMTLDSITAGVDTTSASTFFVLYSLALNPDKQEILRKELKNILPKKNSKLTPEIMSSMPYLRACIKESFRKYPLNSGNFRTTGRNITLQGYQVPKETDIIMAQELLLGSDVHYGESSKFIPERFLRESSQAAIGCPKAKDANPFIYLPFGFGPRMCIGRRFAELEIESLVARLVRNYKISWSGPPPETLNSFARIPIGTTHFVLTEIEE